MNEKQPVETRSSVTIIIRATCNGPVHRVPWNVYETDRIGTNSSKSRIDGRKAFFLKNIIEQHKWSTNGQCTETPVIDIHTR